MFTNFVFKISIWNWWAQSDDMPITIHFRAPTHTKSLLYDACKCPFPSFLMGMGALNFHKSSPLHRNDLTLSFLSSTMRQGHHEQETICERVHRCATKPSAPIPGHVSIQLFPRLLGHPAERARELVWWSVTLAGYNRPGLREKKVSYVFAPCASPGQPFHHDLYHFPLFHDVFLSNQLDNLCSSLQCSWIYLFLI